MRWWDIAQQYQWANSHLAPLIECWDIAHKWDIAHLTLVAADWDIAQPTTCGLRWASAHNSFRLRNVA